MTSKFFMYIILITFISMIICLIGVFLTSCSILQPNTLDASTPEQLVNVVFRTNWLVTLSIIGIAASFFSLLNGFKWGLPAIASCCVALFMSLATARYSGFMAICGLVGSILIMVGSVLVKNKALLEIVTGVERLKENNSDTEDFKNVVHSNLESVQTKHTKNIVKKVKARINGG